MEKSENSIYRWLSTVPEDRQSPGATGAEESGGGRYTCPLPTPGRTAHVDTMGKAYPLTSLPIALEMTDVGPDIRWPRFSKRKRQSPTREEQPRDQSLAKELGNEYERKPRNRTRKDRYEYKTAGSSNQISSNADKQKTKRRLRSRKQTMNEGFRASNVARNRLTVCISLVVFPLFSEPFLSSPILQTWESSTGARHRPLSYFAMVSHYLLQACLMGDLTNSISKFPISLCPGRSAYHGRVQGTHGNLRPPSTNQARRKQTVFMNRSIPEIMISWSNGTRVQPRHAPKVPRSTWGEDSGLML